MNVLWKYASLAACLGKLSLSLFLWSTARRGSWGTWQHWSSPHGEAEPGAMEHVVAPEPTSAGRRGLELRNVWQLRSSTQQGEARGHVATLEPTSIAMRGPELRNTWQRQSSTQQGGEARGHGTRGSTGAHLDKKVRSRAVGHVKVPKLTSIGRRGPELQGMWQRVDTRPAPCLNLKLVYGGTQSAGYRQRPPGPPRKR
jgi:hypothetical protein